MPEVRKSSLVEERKCGTSKYVRSGLQRRLVRIEGINSFDLRWLINAGLSFDEIAA